jgi:superfamily II RNA helicase
MSFTVENKNIPFPIELELESFKQWPFELSDFQKWAIYALYTNKNSLVTAQTGSGKTLPAEWAINHFCSMGLKVIYTTPIKALSNEKKYNLTKKFPHISFGILTGDTCYGENSDCLIMTTEILRNNLFKQLYNIENSKNVTLDFQMDYDKLAIVIFDEIHWINDKDRGGVWDETISLLQLKFPKTQLLGLSATCDNPRKMCRLMGKNRDVWLCPHDKRIVPIYHYGFVTAQPSIIEHLRNKQKVDVDKIFETPILLKQQNKHFNEENYHMIKKGIKHLSKENCWIDKYFVINRLLIYLKKHNELPAIFFVFSKKKCLEIAKKVELSLFEEDSKIPSIIKKECDVILRKLDNYNELVHLPEYIETIKLLEKGIAIHHSGIPKPFRELVEMIFDKGYIKLLIATETMGIGIDLPVKTTIYSSLRKFDGHSFRFLNPAELGQLTGRGGRRGKDDKGNAYYLFNLFEINNDIPSPDILNNMIAGKPDKLTSKFKINFNLILKMVSIGYGFQEMINYMNNSMIKDEIDGEKIVVVETINQLKNKIIISEKDLQYLRTKVDIIKNYAEKMEMLEIASGKQKKKIRRDIDFIKNDSKFIEIDYEKWMKPYNLKQELNKLQKQLFNIEHYIEDEIYIYLKILKNNQFVSCDIMRNDTDTTIENLKILQKGKIACELQEINALPFVEFLLESNLLENLNSIEILALLSIFIPLRVSDDIKIYNVDALRDSNISENLIDAIKCVNKKFDKYYDIETRNQTNFTEEYTIQYDLCDILYNWGKCLNDSACKKVIGSVKHKNIFLGEFIKIMLKLNNMASEIEKICIIQENLELLSKIKEIPQLTLKSIITNKSLYLESL